MTNMAVTAELTMQTDKYGNDDKDEGAENSKEYDDDNDDEDDEDDEDRARRVVDTRTCLCS